MLLESERFQRRLNFVHGAAHEVAHDVKPEAVNLHRGKEFQTLLSSVYESINIFHGATCVWVTGDKMRYPEPKQP